jgi:hypothetical protein
MVPVLGVPTWTTAEHAPHRASGQWYGSLREWLRIWVQLATYCW